MRRMSAIFILPALLLLSLLLPGGLRAAGLSVTERFQEANRLCEAGEHGRAITKYETLAAEEGVSAALYANLAGCYWRDGQKGRAALYSERALRLNPWNADLLAQLARIRQQEGDTSDPIQSRVINRLTEDGRWVWGAVAALVAVTLAQVAGLRRVVPVRRVYGLAAGGAMLFLVAAGGLWLQQRDLSRAVIVSADTFLLLSPFEGAQTTEAIGEGALVWVLKNHQGFVLVRDETGHSGWVPEDSCVRIVMQEKRKK